MARIVLAILTFTALGTLATVSLLRYERKHDTPVPVFTSSMVEDEEGPSQGHGYSTLRFDEQTSSYELAARCCCYESCRIEWIELRVVHRGDWTGDRETSDWTTVARGAGRRVDGHWEAETPVAAVPGPVRAMEIEFKCRGHEPLGGSSVIPDRRNWIERARDFVFLPRCRVKLPQLGPG